MQCMSLWHMFGGQIFVIFWRAIDLLHIFQVTPCRLLCEVTCYIAGFNFYAFRVAEVVSTCCICRSGVKKCVMHCFWFVIHVLLVCCQIAMHVAFQEWHYTVSNLLCVTCCKSGFLQFTTCYMGCRSVISLLDVLQEYYQLVMLHVLQECYQLVRCAAGVLSACNVTCAAGVLSACYMCCRSIISLLHVLQEYYQLVTCAAGVLSVYYMCCRSIISLLDVLQEYYQFITCAAGVASACSMCCKGMASTCFMVCVAGVTWTQTCLVYAIGVENYTFEAQPAHLRLHYTNYANDFVSATR